MWKAETSLQRKDKQKACSTNNNLLTVSELTIADIIKKTKYKGCSEEILYKCIPIAKDVVSNYKTRVIRRYSAKVREQMESKQIPNYKHRSAVKLIFTCNTDIFSREKISGIIFVNFCNFAWIWNNAQHQILIGLSANQDCLVFCMQWNVLEENQTPLQIMQKPWNG